MACRCPLCFSSASHEFHPRSLVLAFGGKQHPFAHQVGEHADRLVALAHAPLSDADATHLTEVRLGIGRLHLPEEHAPQPGVRLADQLAHLAHGQLAHEPQREGFKLLGEMCAQTLPRRAHPEDLAALATTCRAATGK